MTASQISLGSAIFARTRCQFWRLQYWIATPPLFIGVRSRTRRLPIRETRTTRWHWTPIFGIILVSTALAFTTSDCRLECASHTLTLKARKKSSFMWSRACQTFGSMALSIGYDRAMVLVSPLALGWPTPSSTTRPTTSGFWSLERQQSRKTRCIIRSTQSSGNKLATGGRTLRNDLWVRIMACQTTEAARANRRR